MLERGDYNIDHEGESNRDTIRLYQKPIQHKDTKDSQRHKAKNFVVFVLLSGFVLNSFCYPHLIVDGILSQ
jgi:hypothetical protein